MGSTIVLLYPRIEPDWPDPKKPTTFPLAVLTIARSLVHAGYDVRLIDENVQPRMLDELRGMPPPLYVGISCMGGYTIPTSLSLARRVRKLWPEVPRVWGGWSRRTPRRAASGRAPAEERRGTWRPWRRPRAR